MRSRPATFVLPGLERLPQSTMTRNCVKAAAIAVLCLASMAGRSAAIEVVEVEEHWELSVGEPDSESSAPQVTMVMSPTGDVSSDYFLFTLNHRSEPEFAAGGMQVQRWVGDQIQDSRNSQESTSLHHGDEKVTWIQRLRLTDGALRFEIVSGESESWGRFGDEGQLHFTINWPHENLNSYRPAVSLEQSGVNFCSASS